MGEDGDSTVGFGGRNFGRWVETASERWGLRDPPPRRPDPARKIGAVAAAARS